MPRRRFGGRRRQRPQYDWVSTPESYDTCVFFGDTPRSSCDSPQLLAFPLTHASILSLDTSTAYGTPQLQRTSIRIKGRFFYFFHEWEPESFTATDRISFIHMRIVKAQVDLNGDPMTRYTQGSAPVSLAMFESSDEDFLWEQTNCHRFIGNGWLSEFFSDVGPLIQPAFQPQVVDLDITVKRRLQDDEALFFLWEQQNPVEDANIPQANAMAKIRTLMQVPRA